MIRKYAAGKKAAAYYARTALSELTDTVGRGNPRQLSILVERNAAALHCMEQSSCAQHCTQRLSAQADYVGRGRARQPSSTVGRQALTPCWSKHKNKEKNMRQRWLTKANNTTE